MQRRPIILRKIRTQIAKVLLIGLSIGSYFGPSNQWPIRSTMDKTFNTIAANQLLRENMALVNCSKRVNT